MKLKKFNITNMQRSQRKGDSYIYFSRTGSITISKQAVIDIGLEQGNTVSFLQDEETPEDWYISLDDPEGFILRATKSETLTFNSSVMSNAFLDALEIMAKNVSFKLITEPQKIKGSGEMYPIITASAKYKKED